MVGIAVAGSNVYVAEKEPRIEQFHHGRQLRQADRHRRYRQTVSSPAIRGITTALNGARPRGARRTLAHRPLSDPVADRNGVLARLGLGDQGHRRQRGARTGRDRGRRIGFLPLLDPRPPVTTACRSSRRSRASPNRSCGSAPAGTGKRPVSTGRPASPSTPPANLWVADTGNDRVEEVLLPPAALPEPGRQTAGGKQRPVLRTPPGSPSTAPATVWVADTMNNRVEKLDRRAGAYSAAGPAAANSARRRQTSPRPVANRPPNFRRQRSTSPTPANAGGCRSSAQPGNLPAPVGAASATGQGQFHEDRRDRP